MKKLLIFFVLLSSISSFGQVQRPKTNPATLNWLLPFSITKQAYHATDSAVYSSPSGVIYKAPIQVGTAFDTTTYQATNHIWSKSNIFVNDTVGNDYPVLKRNAVPTENGLFYWNNNSKRAVTSSNLTFDGTTIKSTVNNDLGNINTFTTINNLNAWSDTLFLQKYTWHTSSSAQGISNKDSTFVYYYKCASIATAYKISKLIEGNLICWYNSTTLKKGFISYAVNSSDTLKLVIYGARYAAGDKTFRISTIEKIKIWEYFVPGELLADSMSDIGTQHVNRYGDSLVFIGLSAYLQVPAAGAGAECIFGVYRNSYNQASTLATKLTMNSYTSFSTSDLLNNIITSQNTITGRSRITIRIINSAGDTNKANTINIKVYYCSKSIFDSL